MYSTWESYSECSTTCGNGEKTKSRTCIGGICSLATSGDLIQTDICNEGDCKFYQNFVLKVYIVITSKVFADFRFESPISIDFQTEILALLPPKSL